MTDPRAAPGDEVHDFPDGMPDMPAARNVLVTSNAPLTDPRAALAEMANGIDGWIHWPPELIERGLAERGVLLVPRDAVMAVIGWPWEEMEELGERHAMILRDIRRLAALSEKVTA